MIVNINGKKEEVGKNISIDTLLKLKELDPGRVVVEQNRSIIPGDRWGDTLILENDNIEIISFVGGG